MSVLQMQQATAKTNGKFRNPKKLDFRKNITAGRFGQISRVCLSRMEHCSTIRFYWRAPPDTIVLPATTQFPGPLEGADIDRTSA
ncbi:hypothetical protein CSKR_110722 [Clonorchis sinensis]|uniref:Uncharacterized protein n=1 Tax=Clonorchis sinensis TaxID=79923 RepID=A0A3R7EU71_CLOSI|nr:hypothetical protein CSKR_110722 [Clonorchis sinensis]